MGLHTLLVLVPVLVVLVVAVEVVGHAEMAAPFEGFNVSESDCINVLSISFAMSASSDCCFATSWVNSPCFVTIGVLSEDEDILMENKFLNW